MDDLDELEQALHENAGVPLISRADVKAELGLD